MRLLSLVSILGTAALGVAAADVPVGGADGVAAVPVADTAAGVAAGGAAAGGVAAGGVAAGGVAAAAAPAVEELAAVPAVDAAANAPAAIAAVDSSNLKPLPEGWTLFDDVRVPPPIELTPKNIVEEMAKSKYLMVKLYSPYCHHCKRFAPTYQTLYEFYYTEKPPVKGTTFSEYYNFSFGVMNCVAYFDLCVKYGVKSYPTTNIYKDGEAIKNFEGVKTLAFLGEEIETILESSRPGSRPKSVVIPKEKATHRPGPTDEVGATVSAKVSELAAVPANDVATDVAVNPVTPKKPTGDTATKKKAGFKSVWSGPFKPSTTPNVNGVSVPLTAETFQSLVTTTRDPWFIKFYAPWCHHCQAMAPNWEQLAKEMKGKLNIGEVNCDKESRLCKDVHLKGYPTILFFRGGERLEYEGLRGLGDFVQYAEKAIEICEGVRDVDAAAFEALEEKEEVIFLYFYDFATTGEDFMALDRLPLSLIGHARLVKTNDPALYDRFKITTWPRLLVSREGRPTYYAPLTPDEMRNTRQVLDWMNSVRLPIVPELTASNAREIMDGKLVVLGILNRDDQDGFAGAIREMKSAASEWMDKQIQLFQLERQELRDAKQLRIEEAEDRNDQRALRAAKSIRINMDRSDKKEVTFAWVDGVFWQRWLRTTYGIDAKAGERVVINDEDNRRYWDQTITGNPILPSRTSILETLNKVTASPPKIKPKLTISSIEKVFFDIRVTFTEHPYLTLGCILGLGLGAASWFRGRVRWSRGHLRVEDSLGSHKDFKLPLLGTGMVGNGKTD